MSVSLICTTYIFIIFALSVAPVSFVIAVQPVSDEKIHLQDVDGKINTNVPVAASRAFSPLPVQFMEDNEVTTAGIPAGAEGPTLGSVIQTKQKAVFNMVLDVSEDKTVNISLTNLSEDTQIFLIKANAPSNVILDFESSVSNVTIHGLTGHNEWLASMATGNAGVFMEVSTTDAGFYPIVVELLRIG